MPRPIAPERLTWAVDLLAAAPGEVVLEIGQGAGMSSGLLLEQLAGGRYVGIDRSATATAAATRRHRHAVAAGRAAFMTGDVASADFPAETFDAILAVNVNLFWTSDPSPVLHGMRRWLRPDGRVGLFWEPPGATRADEIAERLPLALEAAGFTVGVERAATRTGSPLIGVLGRIR